METYLRKRPENLKNNKNTPTLKMQSQSKIYKKHNKHKHKFWCHSDTGRKSGNIHENEGTEARD